MSHTAVNNLTAGDLVTVTVSGNVQIYEHYTARQDAHLVYDHQLGHHGVRGRRIAGLSGSPALLNGPRIESDWRPNPEHMRSCGDNTRLTGERAGLRRGIILPLLALVIVVMVGFLALAIDLGMLAIAKTQVQQSADLAALTAMRTLNGNSSINYNQSAATTNAQNVVTYNVILGQSLQSSQLAAHLRLVRLQPDHGDVSGQFPGLERLAGDRGFGDRHVEQLCRAHSAIS